MAPTTLVELLRERACRSPERLAYIFLRDGESEETRLVIGELDRRARVVAAALQRLNVRGERALLLYPVGGDFAGAFFGCIYAAVVAVPVPPLGPGHLTRTLPRLRAIVRAAQARLVLTTSRICALLPTFAAAAPDLAALRWLATDTLPADGGEKWIAPQIDSGSTVLLQYTSGSTANPKGVVLTHANILHNEAWSQKRFEVSDDSIVVSWLPLYHDMGLIGMLIGTLYSAARCILMSPEAFLQRPARWLRAISHYRADISGGPNFAFDHCAASITADQRASLDLSSWSLAFVGAEPVRADTLQRFARIFEPCGFRHEAFYPCYGLAEATLLTSAGARAAAPVVKTLQADALENGLAVQAADLDGDHVRRVVGCGRALDDQRIKIVTPDSMRECEPREIGEIWVSGPSVARGYWNLADETERTFGAQLPGVGDRSFLRTGDLGFIDDGELFITGRLKDLIIIDGRNHYPQDIEQTVEAVHPALRPGGCAAFSIEAPGQERLVIVAEVQRRGPERDNGARVDDVARAIRRAVADVHGVEVHDVRLLRPGSIPKTSSGKLRRLACRDAFLTGTLDIVGDEHNVQPAS